MKIFLALVIVFAGLFGAYRYGQLSSQDDVLKKQLVSTQATLAKTLELQKRTEAQATARKKAQLAADIEAQQIKVNELDARLTALGARPKNSVSTQLQEELTYQRELVASLEAQLADVRSGMTHDKQAADAQKMANISARRAALADLQAGIRQQQDILKTSRDRLRDRRQLRLSVQEVMDLQNLYNAAQDRFTALRLQYDQVKSYNPTVTNSDGARMTQKQLETSLNADRRRLKELQEEVRRQDQADAATFKERDKVENEYQSAKIRLENLRQSAPLHD